MCNQNRKHLGEQMDIFIIKECHIVLLLVLCIVICLSGVAFGSFCIHNF